MAERLGRHQLRLLAVLGNPHNMLIVPDKVALSLSRRGLVEPRSAPASAIGAGGVDKGAFFGITPAGLRRLAVAIERGELGDLSPKRPGHEEGGRS
jgi:hypothetical protein